ncbi:hypothetical protein EVAR_33485_1 [Eumeta japonica]|uniref:Uncharacterized protein n=1 Tax=Eumeta variegata TaxID=151549 RepID=A0A4C1WF21_EUMVA|nr:hypothetical protein EVAR_33485_1 [Eumeta japonica]
MARDLDQLVSPYWKAALNCDVVCGLGLCLAVSRRRALVASFFVPRLINEPALFQRRECSRGSLPIRFGRPARVRRSCASVFPPLQGVFLLLGLIVTTDERSEKLLGRFSP